jgi:hypothetical protein
MLRATPSIPDKKVVLGLGCVFYEGSYYGLNTGELDAFAPVFVSAPVPLAATLNAALRFTHPFGAGI